ncbi:hypothetical protein M0R45_034837 [Rubus argutus]|uniref:Uncharacterized protein n=1 Tax=Rubus argutus TaxID=59490 RepID=A0AAW1VUZ5_RUBAR
MDLGTTTNDWERLREMERGGPQRNRSMVWAMGMKHSAAQQSTAVMWSKTTVSMGWRERYAGVIGERRERRSELGSKTEERERWAPKVEDIENPT